MNEVIVDGKSLTIEQVVAVANDPDCHVRLSDAAIPAITRSAEVVARFASDHKIAYGITTGFGAFKDKLIPPEDVTQLQRNILLSHAVGVGQHLDARKTRAMMLIRINTLARGYSGIRLETLSLLLELLNRNILPVIPEKGSLGASGDLAPLAHMSLPLIGEGEVFYNGERVATSEALAAAGLAPVAPGPKEGLALTNGTTMMTAFGALEVAKAELLMRTANAAAALSLEAQNGTLRAYDPRIHALRPQAFQAEIAAEMRALLEGTTFAREDDPRNIQDAYTLRCVPQVHGAIAHAISYARTVVTAELNAVTDNPLVFEGAEGDDEILSGGNFHGEPLALALDFLALAITDLGNISERRIAKLVDNQSPLAPYPSFLTENGGLNSGFMLLQYTAAALASENKTLCHPATSDNIPSSGNVEDHVSMGANAALHTRDILLNVQSILAIELMCACQALDFRKKAHPNLNQGSGTGKAYQAVREVVPFFEEDAYYQPALLALTKKVARGDFQNLI